MNLKYVTSLTQTIHILQWYGIEYDVFINNYSDENVIGIYADITIQIDKQIITSKIQIPIGKEQYYHLCLNALNE